MVSRLAERRHRRLRASGVAAPGGPPAGRSGGGFDPAAVNPLDWGILAAGVLAFIFSLFDYYTVSVSFSGLGSASGSESAWHGFFGWFAALLALIGAALVAVQLFAPHINMPAPARLLGLGAFALATLCVIIALFVFPESVPDSPGYDTGRGFGYWVSLIVIIAGLVLSLMRLQATGGKLPGWASEHPEHRRQRPAGPEPSGPGLRPAAAAGLRPAATAGLRPAAAARLRAAAAPAAGVRPAAPAATRVRAAAVIRRTEHAVVASYHAGPAGGRHARPGRVCVRTAVGSAGRSVVTGGDRSVAPGHDSDETTSAFCLAGTVLGLDALTRDW